MILRKDGKLMRRAGKLIYREPEFVFEEGDFDFPATMISSILTGGDLWTGISPKTGTIHVKLVLISGTFTGLSGTEFSIYNDNELPDERVNMTENNLEGSFLLNTGDQLNVDINTFATPEFVADLEFRDGDENGNLIGSIEVTSVNDD